jgi:hypothetical protein
MLFVRDKAGMWNPSTFVVEQYDLEASMIERAAIRGCASTVAILALHGL